MQEDRKIPEAPAAPGEHWKELAEKASKEQDPKKVLDAVEELCKELDEREAELNRRRA